MHPLTGFNREEIVFYCKQLIHQVQARLETDDVEAAAWRLADALGSLSFISTYGAMGIDTYTGLGFKLGKASDDNTKQT